MTGIFDKIRLSPNQLRAVAERRFEDADALRRTGKNARANGAMYLGGFAIECLLKARLLRKYTFLQKARSTERLSEKERSLWSLCYRSHDLADILEQLPEVFEELSADPAKQKSQRLMGGLRSICEQWTIFARYSPKTTTMDLATNFLNMIKDVKEWLK